MHKQLAALIAVVMAAPTIAQGVAAALPATVTPAVLTTGNAVTVPANTEIWLAPLRDISSKHVHAGDVITMQVSRDVFIHRVLVIPRGAEATGKISYRTGKGALGKSAKIEFDLLSLAIGHRQVPIAAHYRVAGDGNSGWAVATFLLISMLGSLFITGHSAIVPAGSEWRAMTAEPLQLVLDEDGLPSEIDGPLRHVALRTVAARAATASETNYPLNSAYTPMPAEILVHALPPQP